MTLITLLAVLAAAAVVAGLLLLRPWLVRHVDAGQARRAANVTAYRSRVAEIEAEQAAGSLDAETAAALRAEAGARLLQDTRGETPADAVPDRRRVGVGIALALLPILLAGAWYVHTGSWRTEQVIRSGEKQAAAPSKAQTEKLVAELAAHMKAHPADPQGWALLGRSQLGLMRFDEAAKAYAQANQRSGDSNADWLVQQGEAQALASGRSLQGKALQLFQKALKLAPDNPQALWFAGMSAAQRGDKAQARKYWGTLLKQNLPDDVRSTLQRQIASLDQPASGASSAPAPEAGAGAPTRKAATVVLHLHVELDPALRAKVPAGARLLVYARAAKGPPMPLAVQRLALPKFPDDLRLDDSMGVMPTAKLSDYDRWEVVARISRSGMAAPEAGDLQGQTTVDRAQADKPITVRIDRRFK